MAEPKIVVSVCMTAYNVEKYIGEAIESVLNQKTNFTYKLLITEDCSTDGTKDIIRSYAQKYPALISATYNAKNIGYSASLINLLKRSTGEYHVQVDGDDKIAPDKLQLAVEYMNQHTDHAICLHNFRVIDTDNNIINAQGLPDDYNAAGPNYFFDSANEAGGMGIIRRSALPAIIPDWLKDAGNAVDRALYMMAAVKGKTGYLPAILIDYRRHSSSITRLASNQFIVSRSIFIWKKLKLFYYQQCGRTYQKRFDVAIGHYYFLLAYINLTQGKVMQYIICLTLGMFYSPGLSIAGHKDALYQADPKYFEQVKVKFSRFFPSQK